MKKVVILIVVSIVTLLTACSSENEASNAPAPPKQTESETTGNTGVAMEDLSATLIEQSSDKKEDRTFFYALKNNTNDKIEIPIMKDGGFSYLVRDEEGNEISHQIANEKFVTPQVIEAGESLATTIILHNYDAGTYELEVWLDSDMDNTYNQTIIFTVE